MDAEEEESLRKPSLGEEQDSTTAFDAPLELPITAQQCDNLPEGGELLAPPLVTAYGEGKKDVIVGELSSTVESGDEAEVVKEKDNRVRETAEMEGVVVGADGGEGIKDKVLSGDVALAFKKKEEEIRGEGCEVEVIEAENKVVADLDNVTPEVKVEDSMALKAEGAEEEEDIRSLDTTQKTAVSTVDELGVEDLSMKVNDGVAKREVEDKSDVADMAVETREAEEKEEESVMPDKAVESGEKIVGTEMEDRTAVLVTRSEAIEADGGGMEDNSREVDDMVEVADPVNMGRMVDATAEEEGADGDGPEEEALEAEVTEAANESDFAAEEADVADVTEDIEAAEEVEEMEVAEDQSRSVSGGKRKRGKNSKSVGRVPARKKLEEDVCFICFDGGDLVLCDRR